MSPKSLNGWEWHWWHQQSYARWQSVNKSGSEAVWQAFRFLGRQTRMETLRVGISQLVWFPLRHSWGMVGPSSEFTCGTWGIGPGSQRDGQSVAHEFWPWWCKNEALDLVKTVKHSCESWRKLSKEYGATTGTLLHEYTNLLEYDFGTTDGFKKRLLKWEKNQIVDFQKATGEVFSDRLKCAIVLSRSPAPIRTYLRVQNRGAYGALRVALPMVVGAKKGKKGDRGKKGYGKGKHGKSLGQYDKSNEYS